MPIHLEVGKIYSPFLLTDRKSYAGVPWRRPDEHGELEIQGYEVLIYMTVVRLSYLYVSVGF